MSELPDRIAAIEAEQKQIAARLADPALYQNDPQAANALSTRLAEIDDLLIELLERWEVLEAYSAVRNIGYRRMPEE